MAKDLRTRYLAVLLGHPTVLLPVLGGMAGLAAAPFADHPGGLAFFGLVGFATSLLAGAYRATVGRERLVDQVHREIAAEEDRLTVAREKAREIGLTELRKQLVGDHDPRTERILDDLRRLTEAFRDGRPWMDELDAQARVETQLATAQLFDTSVEGLRDALRIYQSAMPLSHAETRDRLLAQREALIVDVQKNLATLGDMLARLQELAVKSHSADQHAKVRQELADQVRSAIRTEQQMRQLEGSESRRS